MAVMNVTTYGFTILAARLLGPAEYGALAAVMGLLLVVNVLSLGLQATGARRVSAAPEDRHRIEHEVMETTYVSALVLGLIALAASPLVIATLNLDSWKPALLIAATAVPLTVMGGQAGILQGERRWAPLAAIYLCVGVGRMAFGAVALVVEPDTTGAMVGVCAGAVVPVVIGWLALRHPSRQAVEPVEIVTPGVTGSRWARGGVLRETFHNSHALLAFFALSNADVVIARSTLDEHQAGLYAGGLILTKAVLFLPQFVVVIAFPSMSRQGAGRRMHLYSLGAVLVIGLVTVVGTAALSSLAVVFIGGPEYADLQDRLWVFAALGTLLAMIQLLIYNIVARQRQRTVLLIWAALVALLVATPFISTLNELLTTVMVIDTTLFVLLLVRSLAPSYHAPAPEKEAARAA
ncbi:MAG: oligosaccharide flippase family protein [Nocardioidaceae bacterium]|nr:oligosaccharide flippase family protein [Nocardioidaceae bacterium]NUS50233.1 oligosaccharide flippase family protein [Nocardioidaceae bacterium]